MVSLRRRSSDAGLSGFAISVTLMKLSDTFPSISFQTCDLCGMHRYLLTSADDGLSHASGFLITCASLQSCDFLAVLMKSVADVELFPEVGDVKRGRGDKNEVAISWSSCSLFPGVSRSTGVVVGILAWFSKEKDRYPRSLSE